MTQMRDLGRARRRPARGRSDTALAKSARRFRCQRSWHTPRPAATAAASRGPRSAVTATEHRRVCICVIRVYLRPIALYTTTDSAVTVH